MQNRDCDSRHFVCHSGSTRVILHILDSHVDGLSETIRARISYRDGECEASVDIVTHRRDPLVLDHLLCHRETEGLKHRSTTVTNIYSIPDGGNKIAQSAKQQRSPYVFS